VECDLTGHIAVITGAAQNIGRAIAMGMAAAGAEVLLTWVSPASLGMVEEGCEQIRAAGGKAEHLRLDLRDVDGAQTAMRALVERKGVVDIIVHNAAIRPRTKIMDVTPAEWHAVLDTNLTGPFFLNQVVIPGMRAQSWGRVIHIGGLDAYWGNPQRPHVVASKLGLVGLVRTQANETARWGITVNAVIPGTIDTIRRHAEWYPEVQDGFSERVSQIPIGRLGRPSEIGDACVFLASDHAAYITGQELRVTGGAYPIIRQPSREY
jgi:3-oxoacyl-[acyl-carrier protein] reductase